MMRRRRTAPELELLPPAVEELNDAIAEIEPTKCRCGKPVFADRCCAVCGENVFDAIRRASGEHCHEQA